MLKEFRNDTAPILELGNGKTRVYLSNTEIKSEYHEEVIHYESEYVDILDVSYDNIVNYMIRDKYSQSDEFALLRQRNEKSLEFDEYNRYCELCKKKAKEICVSLAI